MTVPNVPFKTPLGQDELRTRAQGLSQRHRTILLLVDGKRPLAEVLSLAQKAGSQLSHFEDVMRLGLVELPIEAIAPDPVMTEPGALPTLRSTAVEVEVPPPEEPAARPDETAALAASAQPAPAAATPPPLPDVPAPPAVPDVPAPPVPEPPTLRLDAAVPAPTPPPAVATPAAPERTPPPVEAAPPPSAAAPRAAAPLPPVAIAPAIHAVPPAPAIPTAPAPVSEATLVQQARELLLQTVRENPPPFGSRLLGRVDAAAGANELRDLVLEIERYLAHARRARGGGSARLERARELLGLGNTVVADESRGWRDDDDLV